MNPRPHFLGNVNLSTAVCLLLLLLLLLLFAHSSYFTILYSVHP
jgi:hypothetical protein